MSDYHDRLIARYKRNPVFRFWYWLETRRLARSQPVDLLVQCEDCGMSVSVSRLVTVDDGVICDVCWYGDTARAHPEESPFGMPALDPKPQA